MRICLFSHEYLPKIGGLEQVGATLAAAWTAMGETVTVVTMVAAPAAEPEYDKQFPYRIIRLAGEDAGRRAWAAILAETDLVCCSGVSLKFWRSWRRARKPVVFIHHLFLGINPGDNRPTLGERLRRHARLWGRRWFLRQAAGNIYISRMIRRVVGGPDGPVIYNPVDPLFRPLPDVTETVDFAYFGRMVGEKGVSDLLEATRVCRDRGHRFSVALYGEGAGLNEFKQQARALGLDDQVRWHGFVRNEQLLAAMNGASVVVMPSKWDEPMGIVAIEAMACGKCVIGSAGGGLGEVLNGVCPTFANNDVQQLAERMIEVMTDPAMRQNYGRAALAKSSEFELGKVARQYLDYFRQVLAGHSH